jgi:anti-sigma regulatory factor (Ser/Thr protein kinase)
MSSALTVNMRVAVPKGNLRENNALYLGSLDSGETTQIMPVQSNVRYVARSDGGGALLFVRDRTLIMQPFDGSRAAGPSISMLVSQRDSFGATLKSLAVQAHQKQIELISDIHATVPDRVLGDPTRLRQVLINLVGNAIKFTSGGEVLVRVRRESESDQDMLLHVAVSDTGIGISQAGRDKLFQAFSQVDNSMTRKYGGTGLGLAISARIVTLMGGRIWFESESARGSTFHFTAKIRLAEGNFHTFSVKHFELRGLRALIVDDNSTYRQTLVEMLAGWEMDVTSAADASAALALLSAWCVGRPFRAGALCVAALGMICAATSVQAADPMNGERLAQRWCAACHVVASDQRQANADAPPFDPTGVPEPPLDVPLGQRRLGGMGIHLARALTDGFDHRILPTGGNEVTVRKRRRVSTGEASDGHHDRPTEP